MSIKGFCVFVREMFVMVNSIGLLKLCLTEKVLLTSGDNVIFLVSRTQSWSIWMIPVPFRTTSFRIPLHLMVAGDGLLEMKSHVFFICNCFHESDDTVKVIEGHGFFSCRS